MVNRFEWIVVFTPREGVLWNEMDKTGCIDSDDVDFGRYLTQEPVEPAPFAAF